MDHFGDKNGAMLISPYKGKLVDLMVPADVSAELFSHAAGLHSVRLTQRQKCDLEMLATGGFSPLCGFLGKNDYNSVIETMRLANGTVFPIPVTLSVENISALKIGSDVALRDAANDLLAVMNIAEIYEWDRDGYTEAVCGTSDPRHPLVAESAAWGRFNLAGELRVLKLPRYHDFSDLRLTPKQTRDVLAGFGRRNVVAFQTRNPIHRGHEELTKRAIEITGGTLLIHPPIGLTKAGDVDYVTRVRTYKAAAEFCYPSGRAALALLPLAMRMAGPREAVWHSLIRRNYGANHFIVGRDHASPGTDAQGDPFYEPHAAQELAVELSSEIGVKILPFQDFVYFPDERRYDEIGVDRPARKVYSLSGTRIREEFLGRGKGVPEWLMRKEVAAVLAEAYPPRSRQGACIWFTGLSGAGKSTTAEIVQAMLLEEGRRVTLLDGDVVRTALSKGLGFSKQDRDLNVCRIGFVASEIVKHGGIAICAAISPYRHSRNQVRLMFSDGQFIEAFVDTPLDVCEKRDTKGMYAQVRRGQIEHFTGIDDIYEIPTAPEVMINTVDNSPVRNARLIIEHLRAEGFLPARASAQHQDAVHREIIFGSLELESEAVC